MLVENFSRPQNPNSAASGIVATSIERWKSCAQLIQPSRGYSASDIEAMFKRPQNVREFLQNLKFAGERDLLLQSSFYEDKNLSKFFDGSQVIWSEPDAFHRNLNAQYIFVRVVSSAFRSFSIRLESNCSVLEYRGLEKGSRKEVVANGFMNIEIDAGPDVTLADVQGVFGNEGVRFADRGVSPHGYAYTPTESGGVAYAIVRRDDVGSGRIETSFYLGSDMTRDNKADQIRGLEDDVVLRISVRDTKERTLGNP
jgi:hypothetical protein